MLNECLNLLNEQEFPFTKATTEFRSHVYISSFKYEGEYFEYLWENNKTEELNFYISNAFDKSIFNGYATGIRNVTNYKYETDDTMHPTFFSRWIVSSMIYESKANFNDFVFSRNGHILAYRI